MKKKGTGLDVEKPQDVCEDQNCPFHGKLSIRGKLIRGMVASDKMAKTVTVSWDRKVYVPKFERYEKRRSKVNAHNPDCIDVKKGDVVLISECRPISKTKHFVVLQVVGKESKKEILRSEAIIEEEAKERSATSAKAIESVPRAQSRSKNQGKEKEEDQEYEENMSDA